MTVHCPKIIDFPRYYTKCSGGKMRYILHEIFRVVSRFLRYISCYFSETWNPFGTMYSIPTVSWSSTDVCVSVWRVRMGLAINLFYCSSDQVVSSWAVGHNLGLRPPHTAVHVNTLLKVGPGGLDIFQISSRHAKVLSCFDRFQVEKYRRIIRTVAGCLNEDELPNCRHLRHISLSRCLAKLN